MLSIYCNITVILYLVSCENRKMATCSTHSSAPWLLDELPCGNITGSRLPSNRQVLSVFLFHHTEDKLTVSDAAKETCKKVTEIWSRANIPTSDQAYVIKKINKLFDLYTSLKKNKSRSSE